MRITEVSEVARLLDEFGRPALLYGGNPYRAKAYLRVAERVALRMCASGKQITFLPQ